MISIGQGIDSFVYPRLVQSIGGHDYVPGHHFMPNCILMRRTWDCCQEPRTFRTLRIATRLPSILEQITRRMTFPTQSFDKVEIVKRESADFYGSSTTHWRSALV
jgi:hypothetical protein